MRPSLIFPIAAMGYLRQAKLAWIHCIAYTTLGSKSEELRMAAKYCCYVTKISKKHPAPLTKILGYSIYLLLFLNIRLPAPY